MKSIAIQLLVAALCVLCCTGSLSAGGTYYIVDYPASATDGELKIAVTYTLWVPEGVTALRGIVVHQHGAGTIAAREGGTAAYDLHWQALAKKWDCALLGPSYHVLTEATDASPGGAQLWFDPRMGSDKAFLKSLDDLATKSKHPEVTTVPWVLWGHSGGGIWSNVMMALHPERVVAVWLRSGVIVPSKIRAGFPAFDIPSAVYEIPVMANAGILEKGKAWDSAVAAFQEYRGKGAQFFGFAPDPRTPHWCGDQRYLAIPYLDACMAMRLPDKGAKDQKLKAVDKSGAWLGDWEAQTAVPAAEFKGDLNKAVWLPNALVAKAWMEYIKIGTTIDTTWPPVPADVKAVVKPDGVEITWDCEVDWESGLGGFAVLRDGRGIAKLPQRPPTRAYGRPLFQVMSYHDTPELPLPEMKYLDTTAKPGEKHTYTIVSYNGAGLQSDVSTGATVGP